MPSYRFFLEDHCSAEQHMDFDLPDASVIVNVAKQVARRMASRELESGQLRLAQNLLVFDDGGGEIARYPLSQFIHIA